MSKLIWSILIGLISLGIIVNLALLPWYLRKVPSSNERTVPLEVFTINGIDMYRFNPMSLNVGISPNNASFNRDRNSFTLFHNYEMIPNENYVYDNKKNSFNIQMKLIKEGLQHFEIIAVDSNDNILYENFQFWAGFNTLKVRIVNEHDQPVIQTPVYLELIKDSTAQIIEKTDIYGEVLFENIPSQNIRIESSSIGNIYAIKPIIGPVNYVELRLKSFNRPNLIGNDSFNGWIFSDNTSVTFIPVHSRQNEQSTDYLTKMYLNLNISARRDEQTVSCTFETKPNTKSVKIRYRFIINGISNDSIYLLSNDYFRLTLRSKQSSTRLSIIRSLDMFMYETEWMESSIPITIEQDIVEINITVTTIINHLFDLNLQLAYIEEVSLAITDLELKTTVENSTKFENLRFLSINSNSSNVTEIYGLLTIHGNSHSSLKNITLEIIQKGQQVAIAKLAATANNQLLNKTFGPIGILNVSNILLFELTHDQAALVNTNKDGIVILRVRIVSNENEEITAEYRTPIKLLTRFTGNTNRSNSPNKNIQGGNDWVLPSVQTFINKLGNQYYWNDFSKMNGGTYPQHGTSHRNGDQVDGYFPGYEKRDGYVAQELINMINNSLDSKRIRQLWVTYEENDIDPFWRVIRNVTLKDNRQARDVIRGVSKHNSFFHISINPE